MTFALSSKVTSTEIAVLPCLPATVSDDRAIMSFSKLATLDRGLAERLQRVAQSQVRDGTTTSLVGIESITRRTIAGAAPEDAARFFALVARAETRASTDLVIRNTTDVVLSSTKTVARSLFEAALYPFVSQIVLIGASVAVSLAFSPWYAIPAAVTLLAQGYASFTYFANVKGYKFG